MGRPLEFDPSLARRRAMEVFWQQGYEATSLQDLLRAMSLSKSSFYQAFGSKRELFQACLAAYGQREVEGLEECLREAASGWVFIEELFRRVAGGGDEGISRRGCMLMNTASELCPHDPEIAEQVAEGTESMTKLFGRAVARAQEEGSIPRQRDAEALGRFLVSSMCGLKTLARGGASGAVLQDVVTGVLRGLV